MATIKVAGLVARSGGTRSIGFGDETTAKHRLENFTATTDRNNSIAVSSAGKYLILVLPDANPHGLRLSPTTSDVGWPLASTGMQVIPVVASSTYYLYTTASASIDIKVVRL